MFIKLSVLAFCLVFVSALQVQVEHVGRDDLTFPAKFTVSTDDPTYVDLILLGSAPDQGTGSSSNGPGTFNNVGKNVPAVPNIDIVLPQDTNSTLLYYLIATKVDDHSVEYAWSNQFTIS